MKIKKFIAAFLLVSLFLSSCVSYIDLRKMDLVTKNSSGTILNLKYAGDADEILSVTAEKMIEKGFLDAQSEEFGYYDVRFEATTWSYTPLTVFLAYVPAFIPLFLLGIPTAGSQFTLVAHLYIFDSNGNIVKHYSNTNGYKQAINLYMNGSGATKKGAREFSKLFDIILDEAAGDSTAINAALQEAGSISANNNLTEVQANIDRFFLENPYAQNSK